MDSRQAQAPTPGSRPADILLLAVWFGLMTGLLEGAVKTALKFGLGQMVNAWEETMWLAPLAGLTVFFVPGLALATVSRLWRRIGAMHIALFVFSLLSLLNLLLMIPPLHHYAAALLAAGGAVQISRLISPRAERLVRLTRRTVGWLAAWVVIAAVAVEGAPWLLERQARARLPAASPQAPNVLLIVLDTVRADHLSVYGYERATTPHLEELARRGVVFERALSTAPWTLPSHAGMFTGRYPQELSTNWHTPLDGTYPTLAEQFSRQGYLTAGFVANTGYCSIEHGLARGFIHYEDYRVSLGQLVASLTLTHTVADNFRLRLLLDNDEHLNRQSADVVSGKFLRWLDAQSARPFFVFLNYYDAHEPYLPPAPFDRKFGPGRRAGKHSPMHHLNWNPAARRRSLSPPDLQEEIDGYDGAIAYLDQELGRLFAALRQRGVEDNTLIIVTSDHGEEFGEHGVYQHGNSLYLPSVHVPLLISFPPRVATGQRIAAPVTLRDLPATVVELSGLQARFPGQSLARHWGGDGTTLGAAASPLLNSVRQAFGLQEWYPVSKGPLSALLSEGHRYIKSSDGEELYDVTRDPREEHNLAERPENLPLLEQGRTHFNVTVNSMPPGN